MCQIANEGEYQDVLLCIQALWGSALDTPQGQELDRLIDSVVEYENHYDTN